MDRYFAWSEFKSEERLTVLNNLLRTNATLSSDKKTIIYDNRPYSSGEMEALNFLIDPTTPVRFHIFDKGFGNHILKLHSEFWDYYFSR